MERGGGYAVIIGLQVQLGTSSVVHERKKQQVPMKGEGNHPYGSMLDGIQGCRQL